MILTNKIRGVMVEKGYSIKELAPKLGMAPKTLSLKLRKGVFGTDEAEKIVKILEIENPAEIFFASEVTCEDIKKE